jgi:hypothetical protein
MRPLQVIFGMSALIGSLNAQSQSKCSNSSRGMCQQPVIYVVGAGPQSEKFSRQMDLLSRSSDLVTDLHLAIVLDTTTFFTLSWPGLVIRKADQRTHATLVKRFGSIEGKYELLIIVIDRHGVVKTVSHDPLAPERFRASLRR